MNDILSGGRIDESTSGPIPSKEDDRKRDILAEQRENQRENVIGGTEEPPKPRPPEQIPEPPQVAPPLPVIPSFDFNIAGSALEETREIARQTVFDVIKNVNINGQGPSIEGSTISFNIPQQPPASEVFLFQGIAIPQPQITAQQIDIQPISIAPPRQIIDEVPEAPQNIEQSRIQAPQVPPSVTPLDIPEPPLEQPPQINVPQLEPAIASEAPELMPVSVETPIPNISTEAETSTPPPQQPIIEPDITAAPLPETAPASAPISPPEEQPAPQSGPTPTITPPAPPITTQSIDPPSVSTDGDSTVPPIQEFAKTEEPITSEQAVTLIISELEKKNISSENVSESDMRQAAQESGFQTRQRSWSNFVDPEKIKAELEQKEKRGAEIEKISAELNLNNAEKAKLETYYDSNNPNPPLVSFDVCVNGQLRKFLIPAFGPY